MASALRPVKTKGGEPGPRDRWTHSNLTLTRNRGRMLSEPIRKSWVSHQWCT